MREVTEGNKLTAEDHLAVTNAVMEYWRERCEAAESVIRISVYAKFPELRIAQYDRLYQKWKRIEESNEASPKETPSTPVAEQENILDELEDLEIDRNYSDHYQYGAGMMKMLIVNHIRKHYTLTKRETKIESTQ